MSQTQRVRHGDSDTKKTGFIAAVIAFLISKASVFWKAIKALKYAKFAITAITMSISAFIYGFSFGSWYFGLGFVLLILVHEYGHVCAMWIKGIPASAPVFIPFLGAAIYAQIPEDKNDEAFIGFGGPLIGTIGALLCIALALYLPQGSFWSILFHVLGNVGLFVNLFNMIPARPLDGGRILHPLGGWVVYVGFLILAGLAIALHDAFFIFIAMLTVSEMPVRVWVRRALWGSFFLSFSIPMFQVGKTFDIIMGTLFLIWGAGCCWSAWVERHEGYPNVTTDPAHDAPVLVRIKWLLYYVTLLAIIVGTMIWQTDHLPKEVRESPLVKFMHET